MHRRKHTLWSWWWWYFCVFTSTSRKRWWSTRRHVPSPFVGSNKPVDFCKEEGIHASNFAEAFSWSGGEVVSCAKLTVLAGLSCRPPMVTCVPSLWSVVPSSSSCATQRKPHVGMIERIMSSVFYQSLKLPSVAACCLEKTIGSFFYILFSF